MLSQCATISGVELDVIWGRRIVFVACSVVSVPEFDELLAQTNAFVSIGSLSEVYNPGDPFRDRIGIQSKELGG